MTKKDYELIARALKGSLDKVKAIEAREQAIGVLGEGESLAPYRVIFAITHELADLFEEDNPRFNRDRFTDASY